MACGFNTDDGQILELGEDLEHVGLEMLVELHPWTKVVNSVIVLKVKER